MQGAHGSLREMRGSYIPATGAALYGVGWRFASPAHPDTPAPAPCSQKKGPGSSAEGLHREIYTATKTATQNAAAAAYNPSRSTLPLQYSPLTDATLLLGAYCSTVWYASSAFLLLVARCVCAWGGKISVRCDHELKCMN